MTLMDSYFPFDAGPGANVYEDQWRKMGRIWLGSGVALGELEGMQVFGDSTGMNVKVRTGRVWIEGHFGEVSAQKTLSIAAADPTLPRIDRIVARADFVANTIALGVLTGTPAGSPVAPAVTQSATIWEISLATVAVAAAATSIAAGNVTDARVYAVLGGNRIANDAINVDRLATNAVTPAKVDPAVAGAGLVGGGGSPLAVNPDNSTLEVVSDQLRVKALGIGSGQLAANAVGTDKIADNAVIAGKIPDNSIPNAKIQDNTITAAKIANRTRSFFLASMAPAAGASLVGSFGPSILLPNSGFPQAHLGGFIPADYVAGTNLQFDWFYQLTGGGNANVETRVSTVVYAVPSWNLDAGTPRTWSPYPDGQVWVVSYVVPAPFAAPHDWIIAAAIRDAAADVSTTDLLIKGVRVSYTADM